MIINAKLRIIMEKQLFGVLCYGTVPSLSTFSGAGWIFLGSMFNASSLHTWLDAK